MSKFLAYKSWLLAFLIACHILPVSAQPAPLVVGVLPTLSPRVLIGNYQPFRLYLERTLKQPVELVTATNFSAFHQRTMAGEYDLVVTAAHLARLAQIEGRYTPLATYQLVNRAVLLTSQSTPLKSIKDLNGATVATLDRSALIVSQTFIWLQEQGLQLGKDYKLLETSSHNSAAYSVLSGESALAIVSPAGLKQIDGLFIRDLPNDPDNQLFVKSIADVAHGMGKLTVAEFVEDAATLALLTRFGVDLVQGYFLDIPVEKHPALLGKEVVLHKTDVQVA